MKYLKWLLVLFSLSLFLNCSEGGGSKEDTPIIAADDIIIIIDDPKDDDASTDVIDDDPIVVIEEPVEDTSTDVIEEPVIQIEGVVVDLLTEFLWQEQDDNTERDWDSAVLYCDNLETGNIYTWQLPSELELLGIIVLKNMFVGINDDGYYWTSTEINEDMSWYVSFLHGGFSNVYYKTSNYFVICISKE
jgi:hypothetical protein